MRTKPALETYHRFLDEAGDTTFYGKGKTPIIGVQNGVSFCFMLGMVKFKEPLEPIRQKVVALQKEIEQDDYLSGIPSIQKKKQRGGFFFHATDDVPEVRSTFFKFIKTLDFSFEAVVGRKIYTLFANKHNGSDTEFYADLLSHLLKNKLQLGGELILNIAERSNTTKHKTFQTALEKATQRHLLKKPEKMIETKVVFNVQNHYTEPLLNISDYCCWAVQRVLERGELRYYDFLGEKISLVVDLYDKVNYLGSRNYYKGTNRLTAQNKISPPMH